MSMEMKKIAKDIDLGDNIKLVYQEPEVFSKYHSVYHCKKYGDYYFSSLESAGVEVAKYLDAGYFILKGDKIIGGVFIKPNFMADLFVVPPFNDFDYIADKLLSYLKTISNKSEKIILREIVEEHVPFYQSKGCIIDGNGFWMIRPTERMNNIIPDGYEAKPILKEDKNEIAEVIMTSYKANPAIKSVRSKEDYIKHVENFFGYTKDNNVLYESSRVVINKGTNEIVGVCLHMEFEDFPLIMSFTVRPDHQGKGIGSYLLRHSISCTSEVYNATRLYVDNHNDAIKIYEHLGFIRNRTLNDMYLLNE
ncbi:GNAT family N-acetyltransferase [Oceanirhabdus sp. W0125-5]|uniref:GNAT family N-acetyltransferase n=1 Tax=Oceanirhabdus sp. W0125-5 TaxID=2999116 RepID=UPI0022F2A5E1|nr:GNAT family N-acetyltransferase [Oceanirhabdus sp. W0125-5]WBW96394.1 GNAT family N-acetyltransferase [Oceanirhabdus sp. W0125-5]